MKKYLRIIPTLLFFAFIIGLIVLADLDKKNLIMDIGHAVPWGDKIGHFILFGTLALPSAPLAWERQVNPATCRWIAAVPS